MLATAIPTAIIAGCAAAVWQLDAGSGPMGITLAYCMAGSVGLILAAASHAGRKEH